MQTVITSGTGAAVDVHKIPENEAAHFARATIRAVKRYFEIPGVKEDYEKWLIAYKRRKAART